MKDKTAFKWAGVLFVFTLAWMGFEKTMGWHGDKIDQHAQYSILYDLLFIAIFILAFREKRSRATGKKVSWKEGFIFGCWMTIIITALSPVTQTITHELISPEFFPNVIKLAVENNLLSQTEASARFNLENYILQNIMGTFILGMTCSIVLAWLFKKSDRSD